MINYIRYFLNNLFHCHQYKQLYSGNYLLKYLHPKYGRYVHELKKDHLNLNYFL